MSDEIEIEENTKEILQVKLSPVNGFLEIVQKKKRTHIKIDAITKIEEWTDEDYFKTDVMTIIYTNDGKESRFEAPTQLFFDAINNKTQ